MKALFAGQGTIVDFVATTDGDFVETAGSGLLGFTWVDTVTGAETTLPLGTLNKVQVLTATATEIDLLNEGSDDDGSFVPFPYLLECSREKESQPFACSRSVALFPVSSGVTFGSKPHALLTRIMTTMDGVEVAFGPEPGYEGQFSADYTSIPPTKTLLSANGKTFTLLFEDADLAPGFASPAGGNGYVTAISAAQEGANVAVNLTLDPAAAKYFTGSIEHGPQQVPFFELRFSDQTPAPYSNLTE